jgi:hypothetical protein
MARTTLIIESQYLVDMVNNGVTTQGLLSLVNAALAALVAPTIRQWSLDARFVEKRQNIQWMFFIEYDTGGAALATPFTLRVDQATLFTNLTTAINTFLSTFTGFSTGGRLTKLDSDVQGYIKQYVEARLLNATAGASANYVPL